MSEIPPVNDENVNEWLKTAASRLEVDEEALRAVVGCADGKIQPPDDEKEDALKEIFVEAFYNTRETPYDNAPSGKVWVQFPFDGEVGVHYRYECINPPHPAPDELNVGTDPNWTCVKHIAMSVDGQVREVMEEIDCVTFPERRGYLSSEFETDRIEIVRGTAMPDFPTVKRILTKGFGIELRDLVDARGHFNSEWHQSRFYWHE